MTKYAIAALLHKAVWEVNQMSFSEYEGWIVYMNQASGNPDNLLDGSQEDMIKGLTGGKQE